MIRTNSRPNPPSRAVSDRSGRTLRRVAPDRPVYRPRRVAPRVLLVVVILAALAPTGCRKAWDEVRERERLFAVQSARTEARRGQCVEGLDSLDRAETVMAIGLYAREAITARIRCYDKLGEQEMAAAHRRMLEDFYTSEPMALPEADGSSVFRVRQLETERYESPPGWLAITRPRYTPYAQRSKIVGRVVVSFRLADAGRAREIRVLEMPHPLLGTWAIEAIARAEKKKRLKQDPVIVPKDLYVTTFSFEWRWADDPSGSSDAEE